MEQGATCLLKPIHGRVQVVACGGKAQEPGMSPPETFSFVCSEPHRVGNLVVEKAMALGLSADSRFRDLKNGFAVLNNEGVTVRPVQVCLPIGQALRVPTLCSPSLLLLLLVPQASMHRPACIVMSDALMFTHAGRALVIGAAHPCSTMCWRNHNHAVSAAQRVRAGVHTRHSRPPILHQWPLPPPPSHPTGCREATRPHPAA